MGDPVDTEDQAPQSSPVGLLVLLAVFALLGYAAGLGTLIFVGGLLVMIFLHELGHFLTARWTGMKVTQFFICMGPRLWSFRRGEVEYGVRALPIGAFVRIVGMNNLDPVAPEDEPRAYKNQSYWKKMLVITAGSQMHFLQAIVLFTVALSVVGVPSAPQQDWRIGEISQLETGETPALEAGLELGDTILSIDGVSTQRWDDLRSTVEPKGGQPVLLEIQKADGQIEFATVTLASIPTTDGGTRGFIGIAVQTERERLGWGAGVDQFTDVFGATIGFVPQFFSPSTFANLASSVASGGSETNEETGMIEDRPISMVGVVRIAGQDSFDWVDQIMMLGWINVSVGIVNLLPLLPLDGGHAAVATYERIRSRRGRRYEVDVAKLMPVAYTVIMVLGFLMLTTMYLDIVDPLG